MAECDLCGFPVGSGACNARHGLKEERRQKPLSSAGRSGFIRGYYCAVSAFIRENGRNTVTDSLFRQGGKPGDVELYADESDVETFRNCGLLPAKDASHG